MAKLAVINRQAKREAMVKKYAEKRKQLFAIIQDPKATDDARDEARAKLQEIRERIPLEAALTRLSGTLGVDFSASSVPILQLALSGEGLAEQELFDLGVNFLRPQLVTIPGRAPG